MGEVISYINLSLFGRVISIISGIFNRMFQNQTQLFKPCPAIRQKIEWGYFERRETDDDQHPRESGDFRIVKLKVDSDRHVITKVRVPLLSSNALWHESDEAVKDAEFCDTNKLIRPRTATSDGYTQLKNSGCFNPISFIVLGAFKPSYVVAYVKVLGFPKTEMTTNILLEEISLHE